MKHQTLINEIESLAELVDLEHPLSSCVVQGLDLRGYKPDWEHLDLDGTVFMGCRFADYEVECLLQQRGALIFPRLPDVPYHPYRSALYTWRELMDGFEFETGLDNSRDKTIYEHFSASKRSPDIIEALAQRIHDHAIDDALAELMSQRLHPVGIMGGHGTGRNTDSYRDVAHIAWGLARAGYFVVSGGGPGIMEAANLGAWMSAYEPEALEVAITKLVGSPKYTDEGFHAAAAQVLDAFPEGADSLAIPTWFYGHEPSNLFATHIAKYFSNSLREDGLLALATSGVVYAPGSAGTLQEVFMDLCQNHYQTFDVVSPMVFFDTAHWTETTGVWPMLQQFAAGRHYEDLLCLTDEVEEVVSFLQAHPPR